MTCVRHGNAIVCGRGLRRSRPPAERAPCRWPGGCRRRATQGGWACREHWFRLPPDLRDRLWRAANPLPGQAPADARRHWVVAAAEAERWAAERVNLDHGGASRGGRRGDSRQGELAL